MTELNLGNQANHSIVLGVNSQGGNIKINHIDRWSKLWNTSLPVGNFTHLTIFLYFLQGHFPVMTSTSQFKGMLTN